MGHFLGAGPTLSVRYFRSPVGKENLISVPTNLISNATGDSQKDSAVQKTYMAKVTNEVFYLVGYKAV
jgi:hypothetical protein